jgi:ABC-type Fe3+-hydroxamate transport system substrate-binding protein
MRVISLVPSWTETFIEAGVHVVGRTRFCIHPDHKVKDIAIIGGTKSIHIDKIKDLKPDLIILDKEENTKEIAEVLDQNGLKWFATHVTDIASCSAALADLSERLGQIKILKQWSEEYLNIKNSELKKLIAPEIKFEYINYVIWKNPWMCVGENTFIGDVLRQFNIELAKNEKKYYEINTEDLQKTYCLFSSEPYPFNNELQILKSEGFCGQLIDGECISWFGVRNLNFMKSFMTGQKT